MTALSLRAVDVVKATGVSKGTVSQWINGVAKPSGKNILLVAKALQCDPNWLQTGRVDSQSFNSTPIKTIHGQQPIISWSQAINWSDDQQAGLSDKDWFPCPVDCSDQTFVLRVRGISMAPRFAEGDLIFVDPAINPVNGKYVIVRLGDEKEASFKMIIIEGAQKYLKADNPDWPAPILPIDSNCQIIGTIVFAGRQL